MFRGVTMRFAFAALMLPMFNGYAYPGEIKHPDMSKLRSCFSMPGLPLPISELRGITGTFYVVIDEDSEILGEPTIELKGGTEASRRSFRAAEIQAATRCKRTSKAPIKSQMKIHWIVTVG